MKKNLVTLTDSYKLGHHNMMLPGTECTVSYFEARVGARYDHTMFFGLQYLLKEYLTSPVTKEDIDKAEHLVKAHLGPDFVFDRSRWDHIVEQHGGKLPVFIEAVPEGTVVPVGNVLMQVSNTDPKCAWLTNHLETLLTHVWASSTVATKSFYVKKFLERELEKTCDVGAAFAGLPFMLHDFGMRGVSSMESAGIGGLAHLISFMGTDTVIALETASDYYGATSAVGFSVAATEHSIMTAGGEEGEESVIQHVLDRHPKGILSVVSDSYNYKNCVEILWCKKFKDQVLGREGKLVIRPDSGDPMELMPWTLDTLGDAFGYTVNTKGYKVLNPKVGVIWGDGIDFEMLCKIVWVCEDRKWSAENLVFGMGGGLLQKANRDIQRFAFKACAQLRGGKMVDVYKNPTDASKKSKRGVQKLIRLSTDGNQYKYKTVRADNPIFENEPNVMVPVLYNGLLLKDWTFEEVRENAKK